MILKAVDRIRDMPYNKIMRESVTNGLTYIAELLGGLILSLFGRRWKGVYREVRFLSLLSYFIGGIVF